MIDVWLRADTEAIAKLDAAVVAPFLLSDDGDWIESNLGWAMAIIGQVVNGPGQYEEDGTVIVAPVIDTRWHANLRLWDHDEITYETMFMDNFYNINGVTLENGTEIIWPTTPSVSWL